MNTWPYLFKVNAAGWASPCANLPAVFTQTVYLHAMGFRLELVSLAHLILQVLYGLVGELNYSATTGTDEVVVVFVRVDVLVVGMLLPEDDLSEVPALHKQCERSVDGGLGHALVVLPQTQEEVFGLKMLMGGKRPSEDGLSFRGKLKAL